MEDQISREVFHFAAAEVLSAGTQFTFTATGVSMSPFIRSGDSVTLEPRTENISVGDVVLVQGIEKRVLLHRIIKKTAKGVMTRGDNCAFSDDLTPYDQILGRAVRVSGGGFNFHLRQPFKYLIARRILSPRPFRRFPVILNLCKKAASVLGQTR